MKNAKVIAMVMVSLLFGFTACAQHSSTYKLDKAYEVLREERDEDKALDLVSEFLKENPKNADGLLLRARLYRRKEEFGKALSDVNMAIKSHDKKYEVDLSVLYWWKATIYSEMDKDEDALAEYAKAYKQARKEKSDNLQDISFDYAQALFHKKDYDGADKVYQAMIKADESDAAAMVGLARNLIHREKYAEAIEQLEAARKLSEDYSSVHKFLAQAYDKKGDEKKAIDAAITYLEKDEDFPVSAVVDIFMKRPTYAEAEIKAKMVNASDYKPQFMLIELYRAQHNNLALVGEWTSVLQNYGDDEDLYRYRADAYEELGFWDLAESDLNKSISISPNYIAYCDLAYVARNTGRMKEAIHNYTKAIELKPSTAYAIYSRGWCKEMEGDDEGAMADYQMAIEVDEDYLYTFLMRGEQYLKLGDKENAEKDFNHLLEHDTEAEDGSARHYALHFLGRDDEAIAWADSIIVADPLDAGNWYDKACLLSRMNKKEDAISALRKTFELGFRRIKHLELDDDMDNIREMPEFKAIVDEYTAKLKVEEKEFKASLKEKGDTDTDNGTIVAGEIQMKKQFGGTYEVPCSINGLALNMVFDTGASDITISSVEANFMLKNGYLSDKDIKGKKQYLNASGEIKEGTVITIREVKLGDSVLKNVDASVVHNQKAPLLFGESGLSRFGKFTVDNSTSKLIIGE